MEFRSWYICSWSNEFTLFAKFITRDSRIRRSGIQCNTVAQITTSVVQHDKQIFALGSVNKWGYKSGLQIFRLFSTITRQSGASESNQSGGPGRAFALLRFRFGAAVRGTVHNSAFNEKMPTLYKNRLRHLSEGGKGVSDIADEII